MVRWCVLVAALTSAGCDVLFGLQLVPVPDAPPPGGFCDNLQPHPKFCADFDEGGLATSGWQSIDNAGMAGTITSDTLLASSPPGSVRIDMPANPPLCSYERLHTELTGNFMLATASYAVLLGDAAGSAPDTLISEVGMSVTGAEDYLIYIKAGASGSKVIEQYTDGTGAVTQATHPLVFIPTRVWDDPFDRDRPVVGATAIQGEGERRRASRDEPLHGSNPRSEGRPARHRSWLHGPRQHRA